MQLLSLKKYYGNRFCVALSGGMDSVCLLHALSAAAKEHNITLSALTCEHGIRGEQSKRDLRFVQQLCKNWNIPLTVFEADVPARAKKSGRGLEEEGRIFRYECYEKIILGQRADYVATAHHRDDDIETVLFRLARGTSLGGLASITEHDDIIRPLLSVPRAQIAQYAEENHLPYVTDESNLDETYTRNALRLTVLPVLERAVNGAGEHLLEFAKRAKADDDYLTELARKEIAYAQNEVFFSAHLPAPLFSRACILAMKSLGITCNYTAANVDEISKLRTLQSGKRVCLQNSIEAVREGDNILLCKKKQPCIEELPFALGEFALGKSRVLISTQARAGALLADRDAFPAECVIRTRREGDIFTPFHGQRKSLKKYLTDKKIPARIGHDLPLIAKRNIVYAVFGVEIADEVKTTENTAEKIYLSVDRE